MKSIENVHTNGLTLSSRQTGRRMGEDAHPGLLTQEEKGSFQQLAGTWLKLLAVALLPYLILQLVYAFQGFGIFAAHDEAEHLHVVYALERGERPYLDFIENHPTLFHFFLLGVKRIFHIETTTGLYWFAKTVVYVHFVGCIALLFLFMRRIARSWELSVAPAVALLLLLSFYTPWAPENGLMWQLRPDWVCYFYAFFCVLGHLAFHFGPWRGRVGLLLLAAASGGLATAVLAKSVYIFLPYGIAFALYVSAKLAASELRREDLRRLAMANGLFLLTGAGIFAAMVSLDVWLTGTGYTAYFKANYALNSIKHVPAFPIDTNPFNQLANLSELGLWGAIGLALLTGRRLLASHELRRPDEFHILVFLLLMIFINGLLPAYSNGITWPHYFVPSLLALLILGWLAINDLVVWLIPTMLRVWRQWSSTMQFSIGFMTAARAIILSVAFCWVLTLVGFRYLLVYEQIWGVGRDAKESLQSLYGVEDHEFVPDALLPNDLTYLTFNPSHKPIQAKAWGYYFMLGPDTGMWRDTARLGLGPEPKNYWQGLYAQSPPDVILISDKYDYWERLTVLKNAQGLDISWLGKILKRDYTCMRKKKFQVQVARKWLTRFDEMGWTRCTLTL